jgi:diguanylate cyclase (GGDEF)-like protein
MQEKNTKNQQAGEFCSSEEHEFIVLETLKLLKHTIPASFSAVFLLALIISFLMLPHISSFLLLGWGGCLLLTFIIRLSVVKAFDARSKSDSGLTTTWHKRFQYSTMLTGIVWAVGEMFILYTAEGMLDEHYMFMTLVITGFCVGALLSLSVDKFTMLMSSLPSLVPLYWCFFAMADMAGFASSLAFSLFLVYMYFTARRHGASLHDNLRLRFAAVQDERRLTQILNNSPIAVSISSFNTDKQLFVNESFQRIMATYSNEKALLSSILSPIEHDNLMKQLEQHDNINEKLIPLQNKDEESPLKWVLSSFSRFDYHGQFAVLSWFYDITDRKRMEDKIQHLAHHDNLTGLPNRFLFEDRVNKAIQHAERNKSKLSLMFIDLDGFKLVNDTLGHDIGDELLKAVAKRMSAELRESDTVARLGGDEFGVLLEAVDNDDVFDIAEKLRLCICEEFLINNSPINISCSIGLAVYPDDAKSIDDLLIKADKAMYQVKQSGRNNIALYR